jgi:hypothetical protein
MQRGRNTLILLVVAAALGAYVYFVEAKRTPAAEPGPGGSTPEARVKVFDKIDSAKIDELKIKGSAGETTRLKKSGTAWQIVEPVQAGVDETEVTGLITNLGTVEADRTVDENPKDLGKYGLKEPRVEVEFTADKTPHKLLIGAKTATGGNLYAKRANDNKVLLIPAYLESTFDRTTFQLRDKSILKFDRDKIDSFEITTAGSGSGKTVTPGVTMKFAKQGEGWKMTAPVAARTDSSAVDNIIGRLATGQMKALTAQDASSPADLAKYGLAKPEIQVTLGAGSARSGLMIGKAAEGTAGAGAGAGAVPGAGAGAAAGAGAELYAKDVARPIVFTLEKAVADEVKKTPADFRTKDVFDARAFTTSHLDVTRGGATTVFEKSKVKEKDAKGKENEVEKWTQTQPAPPKPVDAGKIEDAVTKITGFRADTFVEKLPAGAAEVLTINTKFDEGKKSEKVVIHKAGTDYYATRGDDAGAAKLPTNSVDEAIKALDAVK